MGIYVPHSLEGYELCHPANQTDFETIINQVNGVPRKRSWHSIVMEIIHEDEGQRLAESDSPWLGPHALLFRERAIAELKALLDEFGELLPIECTEASLQVFNVTTVIEALDEEASSITRFNDGAIMRISKYVFLPGLVRRAEIFKISGMRASPTFVGEQFVRLWKSKGLRGLRFEKVWTPS